MGQFTNLSKPIKIGNLMLKHRLIQGPMWTRFSTVAGEVTQQIIDYYAARAKGGASMIVIEATAVDGRYVWYEPTLRLDHTVYQPGFARLTEAIHLHGVPAIVELVNLGTFSINPISPSGIPSVMIGGVSIIQPRAMSIEEIEEQRDKFITAAVRAKEIGMDGVLVHGSTAYLLHQFVSPYTNRRTDKYGGSLENRIRLSLEIVRGIREKCGSDFLLGYALIADEFLPGGLTFEDTVPLAKILENEGVDYIDQCVGTYETFASTDKSPGHSKYTRTGGWQYTRIFKNEVKIPISCRTQGDYDPASWEKHVADGDADLVQIAKPTLCDPDIYNKIFANNLEDIRACTNCTYCAHVGIIGHQQVECALSPETGHEVDYAIRPTHKPKNVLIVGGGPGGLEAARVAAGRGHSVTLFEKETELGGNLKYISLCQDNEPYEQFRAWLVKKCNESGVRFELGAEATPEKILEMQSDAVIVATGAGKRNIPNIPGISNNNVVMPEDILTGRATVGKKVVVIGGNRIGMDIAYTLRKRSLADSVVIIEPQAVPIIGYDMETQNMAMMTMCLLPKLRVEAFTETNIEAITNGGVLVAEPKGKKREIQADTIVLSLGYSSDKTLYEALAGKVKELYAIGDVVKPRAVRDAVHEAAFVARQI